MNRPLPDLNAAFEDMIHTIYDQQGYTLTPEAKQQMHNAFVAGALIMGNLIFAADDDDGMERDILHLKEQIDRHYLLNAAGYGDHIPAVFSTRSFN